MLEKFSNQLKEELDFLRRCHRFKTEVAYASSQGAAVMAQGLGKTLLDAGVITHRLPLARYDEGFKPLQEGKAIKVLLYPYHR